MVLCEVVPSVLHAGVPAAMNGKWRPCTLVARDRIEVGSGDIFEVLASDGAKHPFSVTNTRMGVEGWEVEGSVLF